MANDSDRPLIEKSSANPANIAFLYAAFSMLWIVASGLYLQISVADPVLQGWIELAKGMVFVFVTSVLLYLLLKAWGARWKASWHENEARYSELFENSSVVMLLFDPADGGIVNANAEACAYYGFDIETLKTMNLGAINTLRQPQLEPVFRQAMQHEKTHFLFQHRLADGSVRDVEAFIGPVTIGGRKLLLSSIHDITARKQAENKLQMAASVFSHAREGIMITDAAGTLIDTNDAFTQITGYTREEALGRTPSILKSEMQDPAFYTAMWQTLIEKSSWSGEIWNRSKDGKLYAALSTISSVRDEKGKTLNYVGMFTDITQMKKHEQQLQHVAHYDGLTGLPNRRLLADRLRQAIAQNQRHGHSLAVAFLDIDGFKEVNDRYGHEVGDGLLIALAQRMKAAIREIDTLARIGGDEFVAVMTKLKQSNDCEPMLARLLQAAADPITVGETVFHVSASIGVAFHPRDGADADQLLRNADHAMYQAKQGGKNRYRLFDSMDDGNGRDLG
jgi:diguanylate cyclase (GGDEF)-like protein/PAS domain S-box-containing protein